MEGHAMWHSISLGGCNSLVGVWVVSMMQPAGMIWMSVHAQCTAAYWQAFAVDSLLVPW
jgi:hypothetical protein